MNFCPHCGSKIDYPGKFCRACGQPLAVEAEAAPSFKQSFSQLKQLAPNRANFNRVIGFMHANFFLLHAVYLAIFIIALISPWSGLVALFLAALGIYLYGALHSSDEIEWNRKVKEVIMAVGENREFDRKKDVMDSVQAPFTDEVAPEAEVYTEAPVTEPDTFDQMDVAANVVVEPDNNMAEPFEEDIMVDERTVTPESDPDLLDTLEGDIEADLEATQVEELNELNELNEQDELDELDEPDELEELNELEELGALEEMERLEAGEVIVAPEGEAEIFLDNPEEPKV